jgi:hypothetical protein
MKNLSSKIAFLFAIISIVSLSSCNKDKTKTLDLEINYKVGSEAFSYDNTYTIGGTAIKFDLVQFYVSGIKLMDEEGGMHNYADQYLLVKPTQTTYSLGEVPENFGSHLHMLNFNVGIDSSTNGQTESTFMNRASDDPLAVQNPAMHWSWSSGYIFLKIDAQVDTTGDGLVDVAAPFHIGMNNFLRSTSTMMHTDLETGENVIALNFDVAKLFDGVDLSTENNTMTMNNMPLATKVADNIAAAFSKAN